MWASVVEIRKLNVAEVSDRRWTLDSHERTKSWFTGWWSIIRHRQAFRRRRPHWHGGHGHLRGHVGGTRGTGRERGDRHPSWWGRGHRIIRWATSNSTHKRRGAFHPCRRRWAAGLGKSFLHFEVELEEELEGKKTGRLHPVSCSRISNPVWNCGNKWVHLYLFCFSVPVGPEAIFCFIDFSAWNLRKQEDWCYVSARWKILLEAKEKCCFQSPWRQSSRMVQQPKASTASDDRGARCAVHTQT